MQDSPFVILTHRGNVVITKNIKYSQLAPQIRFAGALDDGGDPWITFKTDGIR
jgi:hypothetical protein